MTGRLGQAFLTTRDSGADGKDSPTSTPAHSVSASPEPGAAPVLGQRRLPSAAVSFVSGHIQLLVETRFQSFKKAAQTQQTPKPGCACLTQGADS